MFQAPRRRQLASTYINGASLILQAAINSYNEYHLVKVVMRKCGASILLDEHPLKPPKRKAN